MTFVSEMPYRRDCSRASMSKEDYDEVRRRINEWVKNKIEDGAFIKFHNLDRGSLAKDGVHLDDEGNLEYEKKIVEVIETHMKKRDRYEVINTLGGKGRVRE